MKLNKKRDNSYYNRQALAQMDAQSFNKEQYTKKNIV